MPDEPKKPLEMYKPLGPHTIFSFSEIAKQAKINELEKELEARNDTLRHVEASRDYWKTNYYKLRERVRRSLSAGPVSDDAPPKAPPKASPKVAPSFVPPSSSRPVEKSPEQRPAYPAAYHLSGPGDLEAGRILRGEAAREHAEADRRAIEKEREEWRRTNL